MTTMNISIPENLRTYVEERVSKDGYGNVSEYVRELIRADRKQKTQERLEVLLLEGINSETIEATPEFFSEFRQQLIEKYIQKKR